MRFGRGTGFWAAKSHSIMRSKNHVFSLFLYCKQLCRFTGFSKSSAASKNAQQTRLLSRSKVEKKLMEMVDEHDVLAGRFGHIIEEIATVRRNGQSHTIAVMAIANFIDLPDFLGCKVKIAESLRKLRGNEINPIPVYRPICGKGKRRHPLHL